MVHGPGFVPFGFHIFWLAGLFLIVLGGGIVLIIWAIRESMRPAHPVGPQGMPVSAMPHQPHQETPLDILARRFASGEITAEEYQRARDLLGGGGKT